MERRVRADAVIGGVVDQNGLGVRVFPDGPLHLGNGHAQGDPQPVVALRVDINRNRTAEHQRAHDAAVDVPGQDDLVALA